MSCCKVAVRGVILPDKSRNLSFLTWKWGSHKSCKSVVNVSCASYWRLHVTPQVLHSFVTMELNSKQLKELHQRACNCYGRFSDVWTCGANYAGLLKLNQVIHFKWSNFCHGGININVKRFWASKEKLNPASLFFPAFLTWKWDSHESCKSAWGGGFSVLCQSHLWDFHLGVKLIWAVYVLSMKWEQWNG